MQGKLIKVVTRSGWSDCDCCGSYDWEDVTVEVDGKVYDYCQDNHLGGSYWQNPDEFYIFLYGLITGKNVQVVLPEWSFDLTPFSDWDSNTPWVVIELGADNKACLVGGVVEYSVETVYTCPSKCDGCESQCIDEMTILGSLSLKLIKKLGYVIEEKHFYGEDV